MGVWKHVYRTPPCQIGIQIQFIRKSGIQNDNGKHETIGHSLMSSENITAAIIWSECYVALDAQ